MALTLARVAVAWIAVMLIVPIVILSIVVACLVFPLAWLSAYKDEARREPHGPQSEQDLYNENQLKLAKLWELEGR